MKVKLDMSCKSAHVVQVIITQQQHLLINENVIAQVSNT